MAKVHPNVVPARCGGERAAAEEPTTTSTTTVLLTVWRKSLLFDCKGFTVFDGRGDLAYRVDSYASETGDEVVLMDAAGRPAFTVRRRRSLSGQQWLVFAGEEARRPVYCVRRGGRGKKTLAHVTPCAAAGSGEPSYEVEGSYARRRCVVYDGERRAVAEVRPKEEAVGTDVFRLAVHRQPGSGAVGVPLAMAVVVALEQMFAGPSLLRSWSS